MTVRHGSSGYKYLKGTVQCSFLHSRHPPSNMKLNHETVLVGDKCLLVPYRECHVAAYHNWMLDEALLEATGSEPLSLEEEYAMQRSWREDESKCTFIVLSKHLLSETANERLESLLAGDRKENPIEECFVQETVSAMVGDVNIFLSEEDESSCDEKPAEYPQYPQAEIDIMIAEKSCRGRGIGQEATLLMMRYGTSKLRIRRFFCKINEDNDASLSLFRNKLGFDQCSYAACFKQVEMERKSETPEELTDELRSEYNQVPTQQTFVCPVEEEQ